MAGSNRGGVLRRLWLSARRLGERQKWLLLAASWIAVFALGYLGVKERTALEGASRSPYDPFYRVLQLFLLDDGMIVDPSAEIPWKLEVARFVAPLVTGLTGLAALITVFGERLQSVRLLGKRNHVVVCGLGRKGRSLAERFRERGDRVVVIERRQDAPAIRQLRDHGAIVVIGSASDPRTLSRARVARARLVVAVCGGDGANAEVAVRCWEAANRPQSRRSGTPPLRCLAHVDDPELCSLLRQRELSSAMGGPFRLEFFSVWHAGAQAAVRRHPPFAPDEPGRPHVLVAGLGQMGQRVAVEIARSWWSAQGRNDGRMRMTLLDPDAAMQADALHARYPRLAEVCDVVPHSLGHHDGRLQGPEFRSRFLEEPALTAAYVCFEDDSHALAVAMALVPVGRGRRMPIVVRMNHRGGLTTLLRGGEIDESGFNNIQAFTLLDETCDPEFLLATTDELIARAIHDTYVQQQLAAGQSSASNPALIPWDALPRELRESNHRQADAIADKLRSLGYGIETLVDWEAERFEFPPEDRKQMAIMNHELWLEERRRSGWRFAAGDKNLQARTSPALVPWSDLPQDEREKNYAAVAAIPSLLAKAGFQLCRLEGNRRSADSCS